MRQTTGVVFDLKEFAIYDGPGIRTTVFMKGCPLRCQWCHNPEGLSPRPQLMVSVAACRHCEACQRVCRHADGCIACGECILYCHGGLRRIIGEQWTVEALAQRLLKDADVYTVLGGGVTFSGGEPLMQWPFVAAVIKKLQGIHLAVETSGFCSDDVFRDVMHRCNLVIIDWKVSDPLLHRKFVGADNEYIHRHIQMLCIGNTPFILRMPVIPGVNDNDEHFRMAANMIIGARELVRVEILPYQRTAGAKYEMVQQRYQPDFDESQIPHINTSFFEENKVPVCVL